VGRAAAHFFVIGALLLGVRAGASALTPERPAPLVVDVPTGADGVAVEAAVERALLVAEATRRGWTHTDPVVRRRLVRNLRFVRGLNDEDEPPTPAEEEALLEEALRLGMHRTDPVVRQRLAHRLDHASYHAARRRGVTDLEVRAWMEEHPGRVERPLRVRLSQVFLSRQRRGEALEADAEALGDRLRGAEAPPPDSAVSLGDPLPIALSDRSVTPDVLDRRFGRGLGDAASAAPTEQWVGPVATAYGLHFLWVHEVTPAGLPSVDEARARVTSRIVASRRREARDALLEELRARYAVEIVRGGSPP